MDKKVHERIWVFLEKKDLNCDYSQANQMLLTDQITEIAIQYILLPKYLKLNKFTK